MRVEYKNHLWQVIGDVLVLVVNLLLVLGIIINLLDFVNPLLLFHFQLLGPTLNLLQNSFLHIVLLGQELDRNLLLFIIFFLTEIQCHRLFALLTNLNFNFGKWLWDCFHLGLQMTTLVKKGYVLNSSQNQPVYQFYQEVLLVFVQLLPKNNINVKAMTQELTFDPFESNLLITTDTWLSFFESFILYIEQHSLIILSSSKEFVTR